MKNKESFKQVVHFQPIREIDDCNMIMQTNDHILHFMNRLEGVLDNIKLVLNQMNDCFETLDEEMKTNLISDISNIIGIVPFNKLNPNVANPPI